MDDINIIKECQNGDYQNFGLLYDKYIKQIYNFLYYRTYHKQTAEDLTSIVFSKALHSLGGFKSNKAQFSTWLYQIARNTLIDHFRTNKGTNNIDTALDLPSNSNIEQDTDAKLKLENVKKVLLKLPKLQRDIIVMRVWDGLGHKEIADILNISEANSKMSFSRGIATINKGLPALLLLAWLMS